MDIQEKKFDEVYCATCGKIIKAQAELCPFCGVRQGRQATRDSNVSQKSWIACLLLCLFLSGLAAHRFYVGKIGTGILFIITLGGLGIWWLIDFIVIVLQNFKDSEGRTIKA